jgi:hypothetical protein
LVRAEVAEEADYRHAVRVERERADRAERAQQAAVRASIALAEQRGEVFSTRAALRDGIEHTPGEFVALASAQQDLEDARAEALEAAEFRRWQKERQAGTWADTSAPSEAEVAEAEQTAARSRTYRHENDLIAVAREFARLDREGER